MLKNKNALFSLYVCINSVILKFCWEKNTCTEGLILPPKINNSTTIQHVIQKNAQSYLVIWVWRYLFPQIQVCQNPILSNQALLDITHMKSMFYMYIKFACWKTFDVTWDSGFEKWYSNVLKYTSPIQQLQYTAWPQHQRVTSASLCAHLNHLGYPYPGWTMLVEASSGSELSSSSAAARTGSTSTRVWAEAPALLWLNQGDICALVRAFPPPADPLLIAVYKNKGHPLVPCVLKVSFFAPAEVSQTHPALFPVPHCPHP